MASSTTKTRSRVVVFRLSEDEYDSLKDACSERGGRNLSEFTRSELMSSVRSDSPHGLIRKQLSQMETRLDQLQVSVDRITRQLDGAPALNPGCLPDGGRNHDEAES